MGHVMAFVIIMKISDYIAYYYYLTDKYLE